MDCCIEWSKRQSNNWRFLATVFWFTGLSGAGKSTIARCFYEDLKKEHSCVFLDGDELREVLGMQEAFSQEQRRTLAFQYARLCLLLVKQNTHVICATVSMFDEVRMWNRKSIPDYVEIYVQAPLSVLKKRRKHLYSSDKNIPVVGVNLPFDEPKNPDFTLNNDSSITPSEHVDFLKKRLTHVYSK